MHFGMPVVPDENRMWSGCGNRWLLRVQAQLYDQSERYRQLSVPLDTTDRDLDSEHRRLAEAVLARDAQSACSAISDHMWKTTEIVTREATKSLR
jgi:DNA-binding GntR family transcriptional regulator